MAQSVIIWRILTTFTETAPGSGGPYTFMSGSYVHSILDIDTNTLTAKYSSTSADNTGFEITGGPSLFSDPTGSVELVTAAPFFQYCEGTTLHRVGTSNGYPYATLSNNENNIECTLGNVCDLEISSVYTITEPTAPGSSDGAIVGSATSSNGLIKYSMDPNFPYGSSTSGGTMLPLSSWEVYNSSSEPIVWTIGAQPVSTLTPSTLLVPALSDIYRMPYSTSWVAGQQYTFNYKFNNVSENSDYRFIYMRAYDELMNPLSEKIVAGWGSPAGVSTGTFQGQWQLTAPAGMVYLGLQISYTAFAGISGDDVVTVLQFEELVTADAPGVKTELNFPGLSAGTYTVYAKDAAGCSDSLSFVVSVTTTYNIRYRLEFRDFPKMSERWHRVDIEERAYEGEIERVCSGASPAIVRYQGDSNDPNKPFLPSNMEVQLLSTENEEFAPIFLGDDRKYRVKYYTDTVKTFISPQIYWTGWVIPEFYSEPYLAPSYEVTVTFSDQLGEMQNTAFLDESGNKYRGEISIIKILAGILKLTNLDLRIRCGVNVWAEIMNQTDDPLLQAFVDTRIYEGMKCDVVLNDIAKVFRGQIFQSMGYWWFVRISDAVGTFEYREYDKDGNQVGSGTFGSLFELGPPSITETTGGVFTDRRQMLTFMRNYGKFTIIDDLKKDGNLIDEGRFEEDDIEIQGSGNVGFKRWQVTIGQPGTTFGLEEVDNGDSKGALYVDFTQVPNNASGAQNDTVVYTEPIPFDVHTGGKIRFKFQYNVANKYTVPYARLAWSLKYTTSGGSEWWVSKGEAGDWTIDNFEVKNDVYVTSFESWQSADILLDMPGGLTVISIQVFFYMHDHRGRDFVDIDALKAFTFSASNYDGVRKMVRNEDDPVKPESYVYESEYSYDAESLPDIVRPNGYDAGDSSKRWLWRKSETIAPLNVNFGLVNRVRLDNVSIASYPSIPPNATIIDPPQTLSYSQVEEQANKSNFEMDVILGDMIRFDEEEGHYKNERYIYRSYIRLSDGTPTRYWHRLGVLEAKLLLSITLDDYIAQFKTPKRKLSGSIVSSRILHFINSIRDNADVNFTRYRPMTFEFDVKNARYTIDMGAVGTGEGGEPPLILGAFSREEYSAAYDGGYGGDLPPSSFDSSFAAEEFE